VDGEGLTSSRGASPSATPVDDYTVCSMPFHSIRSISTCLSQPLMVRSEPDHTNGSPLLRELLRTLIHVTLHTPQFLNASPTLRDVVTGLNPHEVSSDELVDQISKIVIQEVHGFVSFPIEVDTDEDEVNHDSTYTNQIMEEIPIQDAHATVSNPSPPTGIPAFDDLSDSHDVMYGTSAGWAGEEISDGKLESVHLDTTQSWRDSITGITDDGDQSCTDTDHESDNHSDAGTSGYAKIRAGWDKSDAAEDSASYQPLKRRQWAKLLFILVLVILGCFAFFVYDYGVRPGVSSTVEADEQYLYDDHYYWSKFREEEHTAMQFFRFPDIRGWLWSIHLNFFPSFLSRFFY